MLINSSSALHVNLTLTEHQAKWLRGVMKNPIGQPIDQETDSDNAFRREFWDALTKELQPVLAEPFGVMVEHIEHF